MFQSILIVTTLSLAVIGCEGNPGAPGQNRLPDDRYPPTVDIILPIASKTLYSQSTVEAIMLDDDSIAHYDFLIDGIVRNERFTVRRAPTLFSWDAADLITGRHTFQMRVADATGKIGYSALMYLSRSGDVPVGLDTLRYYTDSTGLATTKWLLPADSLGSFAGLGTRFTPDDSCLLKFVGIKLFLKRNWAGTRLSLEIYTEKDAKPDSLLASKVILLRNRDDSEFNEWVESSFRSGLPISGEFFAVVTLADEAVGDTMAIQTDDGGWANGHGLMKTPSGEYQSFNFGRGRKPNPLIYALVQY